MEALANKQCTSLTCAFIFLSLQLHYCVNLLRLLPGADDAIAPSAGKEDRLRSGQDGPLQEHLRRVVLLPHPHCAAGCGWRPALWVLPFSPLCQNTSAQDLQIWGTLLLLSFRLRFSIHHTRFVLGHTGCLHVGLWNTGKNTQRLTYSWQLETGLFKRSKCLQTLFWICVIVWPWRHCRFNTSTGHVFLWFSLSRVWSPRRSVWSSCSVTGSSTPTASSPSPDWASWSRTCLCWL